MGLLIVYVDGILFGGTREFENRVQQALERLKLGTIKKRNFDFLGLSVATYSDHIEVKPVMRDVIIIQKFGNMAADTENGHRRWNGRDGEIVNWDAAMDVDFIQTNFVKRAERRS